MDKENIKQLTLIFNISMSVIWISVYLYFRKHLKTHHWSFDIFIILLPLLSIWVHHIFIAEKINQSNSDDEFLKYLGNEIQSEDAFIDILPVTIFGTGILLTNYISNLSTVIRDFYLLIVFGLLVPLVIRSLTAEKTVIINTGFSITKRLIHDIFTFGSESIATTIFFIILNKLFVQNYDIYKQYMVVFKDSNKMPNIHLKKYAEQVNK
tara:strand:+ start:308 stop:934 length:627 start_codon:yes stop_codon:yes gene_type:complete